VVCLTSSEKITDSLLTDWTVVPDMVETVENVKLGVRYIFPHDDKVSVTFTCLPSDPALLSTLKIERVKVSDIKLPTDIKVYGDYVYDITTGMADGTFKYDVTLPKPEDREADVAYLERSAEEVKNQPNTINIDEIKPIEENKINQDGNKVKAVELDHFTIFIVTNPGSSPTVSSATVDDQTQVTVIPGATVTVKLNVTTSGS